jgi:poly(3-hydroxybutyrate) depolymerase
VYTFKPVVAPKGILLVFHGTNRNAADYRRYAEPLAKKAGFVVAAALFDEARFSSTAYNRGNVLPGSSPSTWTTRFVPKLVTAVKAREGSLPVYIFGFSAGGQFVSRVAAFESLPGVERIVGGGASTYVLPKLGYYPSGEAAPYGMGRISNVGESELTNYLAKPYSIIVGSEDTDTSDPNLSATDAAMRQGTQRLDRAKKTFAMAQTYAAQRSDTFGWDLSIVDGVGHSASTILRSAELQRALRLPAPADL